MMKTFAILGIILIFWCHQSHHHLFLFINTSPLGLASEEFIPAASDSDGKQLPATGTGFQDSVPPGSQSVKSDGVNPEEQLGSFRETQVSPPPESVAHSERAENGNVNNKNSKLELEPLTDVGGDDNKSPQRSNERSSDSPDNVANDFESIKAPSENGTGKLTSSNDSKKPDTADQIAVDLNNSATASDTPSNASSTTSEEPSEKRAQPTEQVHPEPDIPSQGKESVSDASSPSTTPQTPQKEEEPIPSFMEWTQIQQQKLHESNLAQGSAGSGQTNGHNGHKNSHHTADSQQNESTQTGAEAAAAKIIKESNAKNFASPDCGAKVIQSNPESQNSNGVLSSSHDEYMLNKCGIPIWFVVELCEPLKIEKVSLGNLELFSSSPKDVEIGISDRYPTRDWTKLGPFTLPDIRAIHSISFPATNASTFGKFLKVSILSHYGTEHFCPMSLVKVNGISEYEVLESENIHPDAEDKEESALFEEPVMDQGAKEGNVAADKSVFGSAKDVVINIVKKAAQVLGKSENKDSSKYGAVTDPQQSCRSLLQCLPNYELQLREGVLSLLSCNFSDLLPFLSKNSPWCGWDYCHSSFSKSSIGLPWQPEGFYASIFGGPSVLHALCNYHRPLPKEPCDTLLPLDATTASNDGALPEGYINESLKSPPVVGTYPVESEDKGNVVLDKESNVDNANGKVDSNGANVATPEATNKGETIESTQSSQPAKDSASATVPNTNGESQQNTATPPSVIVPPITPGNSDDPNTPAPVQHQNNQQQQQAGQQQQQKESVFVRLSNRIKTLERNQSLTASYLEELSRRFKKQNEENNHINEGTKHFVNESRSKFTILEEFYKIEIRSLRRNTDEVRERLFNVQLQRSVLILFCFIQLFFIVCIFFWAKRRFGQFESQLRNLSPPQPTQIYLPINSPISTASTGSPQPNTLNFRKRINSEASSLSPFDKSKKIKKKKKKLAELKLTNVKSSGPSSAPIDYQKPTGEFKFEYPPSSSSAYEMAVLSSFKENIKPEPKTESDFVPDDKKSILFGGQATNNRVGMGMGLGSPTGVPLLATQVDSPFSMMSSTGANFYMEMDPGVSTSSRFALLASPSPCTTGKQTNLKRSGSLTSLDDRSSMSSCGDKTGTHNSIVNGHGDSQSQHSNGSGKKRKNKGLKAFMPKIFDR